MNPVDFRNETFDSMRAKAETAEKRWRVYCSLRDQGPGTTREVAGRIGVEVHAVRPRFTELYQMGFVTLVDQEVTKEGGIYCARSMEEYRVWLEGQQRCAVSGQLEMAGI